MPLPLVPFIPSTITVHLGAPSAYAENVTVNFSDYVKNVASSEIYPTWELAAIRANVLAIVSFALNRVYTEYYTSRGYDFQITSTTANDQRFIRDRSIFEPISLVVDDLFDDYIRRQGFVEPLSAKFCNGTTTTCAGLSQWGSQGLAQEGYNSVDILRHYYGDDIELVVNAPVQAIQQSYPGAPLRLGSVGTEVAFLQTALNRVSRNYPAIPKVSVSGVFDANTQAAVEQFQQIFSLTPDGIVGKATWYELLRIYVGVNQLSELVSQGQTFSGTQFQYPGVLREGDTNGPVRVLQYMLSLLAEFNSVLRPVTVDGVFGAATTDAVTQYQRQYGLTADGVVGQTTWNSIFSRFNQLYPALRAGNTQQSGTGAARLGQYPGQPVALGQSDTQGGAQA